MLLSAAPLLLQLLATPAPQDQRLLRDARAAQVRFESLRRTHLPRERHGGSGGRCDAYIGRYCYWYDSIVTPPVPEPVRISEARGKLLAVLDSASVSNPDDGWLAGQRTRYLIEGGRLDEAVAAARACRAERWWCAALEGLSLHVAERYPGADSAFSVSLQNMSEAQRCEWSDLSRIVADRLSRELSRASCDERAQLTDRLWLLGQPLWSTAGRDLRSEHLARHTMATILARSANAYGMSWGDDSRELMVRYGWAEWFTREDPEMWVGVNGSARTTGHDREPSYSFLPDVASARPLGAVPPSAWRLREATARSRYSPRHVANMTALPHQLVRFPRGDSMRVDVAYSVRDTAMAHDSVSVGLGVYGKGGLRVEQRPAGVPITMLVANDTLIVSIEARGEQTKRAARARYSIDPLSCKGVWCLSDLLLYDPVQGPALTDIDRAMSNAIVDGQVGSRTLGVLWEIQGTPGEGPQPLWIGLTVEPLHVGLARRVATRLHLAPSADPVRLRWQAALQSTPQVQSVTVGLPASARGKYRVVLTIEPLGLKSAREIEVR